MKANELRIGNWVDWEDKYYQIYDGIRLLSVDDIDSESLDSHLANIKLIDLKPIPLTEEWFFKFGFEKPAHSFICDRFHITKQDNSDYWFSAFNKNNAFINKIKHVHQLQNLYFTLTNEELKLTKEHQ